MTPSHAKKGSRRYRYYVRPALNESPAERGALRWPAQDLEDAVLGSLIQFLTDDARLGRVNTT